MSEHFVPVRGRSERDDALWAASVVALFDEPSGIAITGPEIIKLVDAALTAAAQHRDGISVVRSTEEGPWRVDLSDEGLYFLHNGREKLYFNAFTSDILRGNPHVRASLFAAIQGRDRP